MQNHRKEIGIVYMRFIKFIIFSFILVSCNNSKKQTYHNSIKSIAKYTDIIELHSDDGKGRIAIAPAIQGKVITTTYGGLNGVSNGWLNKNAIQPDTLDYAAIGGEDRIWFGPLGGQHSFYYQQIKPLDEKNWKVPASLSSEPYKLIKLLDKEVLMSKEMKLINFVGTKFNFKVLRKIKLLEKNIIEKNLAINFDETLDYVAYESAHSVENIGDKEWKKETGLVSLWSAGMFEGSDETVVIIPLKKDSSLDDIHKYMGSLDTNRLQLKNNVLLFKADGKYRSKIGVSNEVASEIYGSYSKDKNRLTIVQYRKTNDTMYSNSTVSVQENPYKGEVIPIYNNGMMDYSQTNQVSFFELESTSSMVELLPNERLNHYHRVYHFSGSENLLTKISEKLLGINLKYCVLNAKS